MQSVLIVLPTYNEEVVIQQNVLRVLMFCDQHLASFAWRVCAADNGSTDHTVDRVRIITHPRFSFFHTDQKGRGFALRKAWLESREDLLVYMDADLSVNLESLPVLLHALAENDLATGSRFAHGSQVERTTLRELSGRIYMFLVKCILHYPGNDVQCGFKGIRREVFQTIVPHLDPRSSVQNSGWFFDTELLVFAHRLGFRIKEIPIEWIDKRFASRKSRVKLIPITYQYIRQLFALKQRLQTMQTSMKERKLPSEVERNLTPKADQPPAEGIS